MPPRQSPAVRLRSAIRAKSAAIAVIGLGYVGLPLACLLAEAGFRVHGLDIDPAKAAKLNRGRSYIRHIPGKRIAPLVAAERLSAGHDFRALAKADIVIICVPTPLSRQREPDLSFVARTADSVAAHLRRGQLIVLESSTYPGTTREILQPKLEAKGLRSGRDFFLAYSPEREDPGNRDFASAAIPRIVGGDGRKARDLAQALYATIVPAAIPVASLETAEAVKLTENIFRAVNIALVNELKMVFDAMGIDIWEVIDAAKTKPFGYMPFYPGPGLGGHCIPIDPFYLTWKAREFGIETRFIELAGEINTLMPHYVLARAARALNAATGRGLRRARILMIGLAYKKNVDDMRESPALALIEKLEAEGARVRYHDPFIPRIKPSRAHGALAGRRSIALSARTIAAADLVLVVTDHDAVDWALIGRRARLVVDTRNAMARAGIVHDRIVKA